MEETAKRGKLASSMSSFKRSIIKILSTITKDLRFCQNQSGTHSIINLRSHWTFVSELTQ